MVVAGEARFVLHQDLQTVLRCHIAAFADLGGVPAEILYDRMKTAVIGEAAEGGIVYPEPGRTGTIDSGIQC